MKKFNKNRTGIVIAFILMLGLTEIVSVHAFSNPSAIAIGTVSNFAILAGSAVTGTGVNTVTGDVGLSPTTGAAITLLTCAELTGASTIYDIDGLYAGGGGGSTLCLSANNVLATTAKTDLALAYTDAASAISHPIDSTIATDLIGQTLTAGVYNSASGTFSNSGTLTLDGENDPTHIFIFKMATTLITSSSSHVVLINGAKASNVFWVVGSSATLGSSSDMVGNIMAVASITLNTSATINGRLLADSDNNTTGAVTLDGSNTVLLDITAPTVTITDDEPGTANIAGGDVIYTFTFSEAVTGFTVGDITVAGGTKGTFTPVSGTVYTLAVTPTVSFEGNITVDVAANVAFDTSFNGNTVATQSVQVVDTLAPTVVITDDESGTATLAGGDVIYTFTFSEAVTGFTVGDITVAGGTKGTFTPVSGTVYTLAVTPTVNSTTNITVDVAGTTSVDVASNPNIVATQSVQGVNTFPIHSNGGYISTLSIVPELPNTGTIQPPINVMKDPTTPPVVIVPKLPKTGFPPEDKDITRNIAIFFSVLTIVVLTSVLAVKKIKH